MERLVLVATLKPGAQERAAELVGVARPMELLPGSAAGAIFVSPTEVVFLLEGDDPERHAREFLDDPVRSTALAPWLPLFAGPLHRTREAYAWERPGR